MRQLTMDKEQYFHKMCAQDQKSILLEMLMNVFFFFTFFRLIPHVFSNWGSGFNKNPFSELTLSTFCQKGCM